MGYPASIPGVITVGAVDSSGKIWQKSNFGANVMLTAPGVGITTTDFDHAYMTDSNGTSISAAYVSATAALLRSKFPDLSTGQIANRLVKTAKLPKSVKGLKLPDEHYGYGFIRPYSALTENIPPGSKNGPLPAPSPSSPVTPGPSPAGSNSSSDGLSPLVVVAAVACLGVLGIVVVVAVVWHRRRRPVVSPPSPYGQSAPGTYGASQHGPGPDGQNIDQQAPRGFGK